MTTPATQSESTAVAKAKPALPPEAQRMIDERQTRNLVAAKIAGMSWGKDLDMIARRALADWGTSHGVDVTTEIFILGARIYKNADYYINRAQPYVRAGLIALDYRYVNVDKRLDALVNSDDPEQAADAKRELHERIMLRIKYNVPESAQSSVLFTVRFPKTGESFTAAKWCGGGTRKGDPVGDGNPEATAMTRACRKALKMAVGYDAEIALAFGDAEDETIGSVEEVIERSQREQRELNAATLAGQRHGLRNIVNEPALTDGINDLGKVPVKIEAAVDLFGDDMTDEEIVRQDAINEGH